MPKKMPKCARINEGFDEIKWLPGIRTLLVPPGYAVVVTSVPPLRKKRKGTRHAA